MNSPLKRERTTITNVEKAKGFWIQWQVKKYKSEQPVASYSPCRERNGLSSHLKIQFYAREKSKEKLARCEFSHNISSIKPSSGKKQRQKKLISETEQIKVAD